MTIPVFALVGRPNVGKSTLFNRLVGRRQSIVEDRPGITRDRLEEVTAIGNKKIKLIDTGGLSLKPKGVIERKMSTQAWQAVEDADVVLFVLDALSGFLPEDRQWLNKLQKLNKKIIGIVNKLDSPKQDHLLSDFSYLGIQDIVPVSAEQSRNFSGLQATLLQIYDKYNTDVLQPLADTTPSDSEEEQGSDPAPLRLALIGRPNVGKSTLLNTILGRERSIVHDEPGTTRDPVIATKNQKNFQLTLVDTAGIRKRASTTTRVEKVAVLAAKKEIELADVIFLVIDGTLGPSHQDAVVAGYAHELQKPMIILINKWDEGTKKFKREDIEGKMELTLSFIKDYPLFYVSAKTGKNIDKVFKHLLIIQQELEKKIKTGELNRAFAKIIDHHPLPVFQGRPIKMFYATQVGGIPPTFIVFCNHPDKVHFSYQRYVLNALREIFEYKNIPIRVVYKKKS